MRILRGLTSRLLPCGCVAGVYETYDGVVVVLLDQRQATCSDPRHTEGNQIPNLAAAVSQAEASQPRSPRR